MSVEFLLNNSPWMSVLSTAEQQRVRTDIHTRTYYADAIICRRGDEVNSWVGVIDGIVKINNVSASGKATTLIGFAPGAWFGEGSLLKEEQRRYDVVALRKSELAFISKSTFFWLLDNSFAFNRFLVMQLNKRLGQFIAAVENGRLLDVDTRVARCLATMIFNVWNPQEVLHLKISQGEVAQLAGVSRQRVNAALKLLEEHGLIKVSYNDIQILDLEGLNTFDASTL
jgi:CRP/FNR family transcriptional regulator, cyclic AMP receptor protein